MAAQPTCPLLELPPELRNRIYEELLVSDEEESVIFVADICYYRKQWKPPSILHTCRTIRNEASSVYYANVFQVRIDPWDVHRTLHSWLKALGPETRKLIQDIRLGMIYGTLRQARLGFQLILENLEHDSLRLPNATFSVEVYRYEREYQGSFQPYAHPYAWLRLAEVEQRMANGEGVEGLGSEFFFI